MPLGQSEARSCAHCGRSFTAKNRARVYCYNETCKQGAYKKRAAAGIRRLLERTVNCDGCDATFVSTRPEARWCSKACANRHWGNVRARQRRRATTARYIDRAIFDRDGWICHICKASVDPTLPRTHDAGATIDHVIPLSRGGTDEPSNVATAHWRCNREKRAKLTI